MELQNLIGQITNPKSGAWLDNVEPATRQVFPEFRSETADVEAAVQAARAAFQNGPLHHLKNDRLLAALKPWSPSTAKPWLLLNRRTMENPFH